MKFQKKKKKNVEEQEEEEDDDEEDYYYRRKTRLQNCERVRGQRPRQLGRSWFVPTSRAPFNDTARKPSAPSD